MLIARSTWARLRKMAQHHEEKKKRLVNRRGKRESEGTLITGRQSLLRRSRGRRGKLAAGAKCTGGSREGGKRKCRKEASRGHKREKKTTVHGSRREPPFLGLLFAPYGVEGGRSRNGLPRQGPRNVETKGRKSAEFDRALSGLRVAPLNARASRRRQGRRASFFGEQAPKTSQKGREGGFRSGRGSATKGSSAWLCRRRAPVLKLTESPKEDNDAVGPSYQI